jgi:hypothetical protein
MAPSPDVGLSARACPIHSHSAAAEHREDGGAAEPVLCEHCGRTASNGISCIGMCVADSGY